MASHKPATGNVRPIASHLAPRLHTPRPLSASKQLRGPILPHMSISRAACIPCQCQLRPSLIARNLDRASSPALTVFAALLLLLLNDMLLRFPVFESLQGARLA